MTALVQDRIRDARRADPEQVALDLAPLIEPEYEPHLTLAERFDLFHGANPHVAHALEALAGQWLARHQRVGVKALFERLRWESGIATQGDAYRLNNSYTSLYARLLVERRPEWVDRIEMRALRAT